MSEKNTQDLDENTEGLQDEATSPVQEAKPAEKTEVKRVEKAKKPEAKAAEKPHDAAKGDARTVKLPAAIAMFVVGAVLGFVVNMFAGVGGSSSVSLNGTTTLAADQLDAAVASYTYNGQTTQITAREVLQQNGSVENQADSDGNYAVPAATDIVSYARNQIVLKDAEAQGVTVSDEDVDAYAQSMFGSSDYSSIATQYSIDEDTAKETIKQSAIMSKLRDTVVTAQVPEQPTSPTQPADGAEDTPTADYASYIINLAGDEWDSENNTWASEDGDYAKALSSYEITNDSATYAAAQAAYYVAYSKYSTAYSDVSNQWTAYCNTLLSNATMQIGSLAV